MHADESWRRQLAERIHTPSQLREYIDLTEAEIRGIEAASRKFAWWITPYYASLMHRTDRSCPIRRQAVPDIRELEDEEGLDDPLAEDTHSPASDIVRLYPDRVAWWVSRTCAVLCRHCLRRRMVGREGQGGGQRVEDDPGRGGSPSTGPDAGKRSGPSRRQAALAYIREHREIRDVLLTGGDPLLLADETIDSLLSDLRRIDHVEIVRIGTRIPCTLPQRVTSELCSLLARHQPVWLNTQFNHPRELTAEAADACARLADAGVPVGNQTVLLRDINDDPGVMLSLVRGLVRQRVRPYYLFQCERVAGTAHLRTPIETGQRMMAYLRGHTTGFAVPNYVLDTPLGKVPIEVGNIVARDERSVTLRAWDGRLWREPNRRGPG
jgi:lysine 2,3-aminomutase